MKHFNMIVNIIILIFADKPPRRKLVSKLSRTIFRHDLIFDITFQGIAITSHTSQWRIQDFPEGDANPKGGGGERQPIIQPNVPENCIKMKKQECIQVGCVPSAAVAVCWGRGLLPGDR